MPPTPKKFMAVFGEIIFILFLDIFSFNIFNVFSQIREEKGTYPVILFGYFKRLIWDSNALAFVTLHLIG